MGLVYKINCEENGKITIDLTLSTKNCPMGDVIINDVEQCLQRHFPQSEIVINIVWEPRWSRDFLTAAGKRELGILE